ncbi:BCCT family transporter [Corynebacterium pseudotuberculosis]|uniref:BCCT family transporter n=1 Tax=Corynebacterium pseudotuberculosis 258 TaxID=1168865 RepID=A0AAU8PSP6_CORPS|nr:BCCT family transporter [Corynebacterium pseudotuberculosis]AEQ07079.3 BCCT family transporter [Corynebacterium pseudotuberculosis CIP 52.97]AFB72887.1 BCCT family transporter [Corynebacterium pseudotuberculosis 316]AFK17178.1 BCCT family transporter [Corynebacterium pseudotuberculosis 258]AMN70425.1 BCCT family transporter [Corynebacterium pseudotuberculosis]AMN72276.1 multidrug DMT transporter permease [Corynebacterium pseudotuberculosis]
MNSPISSEPIPQRKPFLGLKTDPFIFLVSLGFVTVFVIGTIILGSAARDTFTRVAQGLLTGTGWLYIGGVSFIFLFLVGIFISRFGRLRLGDDNDEPEHSLIAWFCMLFAGGVGAVLMFWGVAEPLNHAVNVPRQDAEPLSEKAITEAFAFTFYHFGIHMWAIFALPGLALGYFIYKRKLPPRVSSVFAPILGSRIYDIPGKLIDALSIIATTFGIAVSVGLGVLQINSGLQRLWGLPEVSWAQLLIILVITAIACVSVASGLEKGIKILSNVNIALAVLLMFFVLISGPTLTLLRFATEAFGIYAKVLPDMMFWADSYGDNPGWQGKWTVFYWAWTICWSPYVGMFVARISRGRTVREYIGGVLALPAIFSVIWFAIFGRAGIEIELNEPGKLSGPVVQDGNVPFALFGFFQEYPWTSLVSTLALVIVVIFFITSIDSAGMVNDMFSTGEEEVSPVGYRILWVVAIGAVAGALLIVSPSSGIATLQEVVIIVAFPFFITQFIMMYSLMKGMMDDSAAERRIQTRQWRKTDTAEKLEAHEAMPAPGYDEEGNELPVVSLAHDEDGNIVIPGSVVIEGNLGITGDVVDDQEDATGVKIVEHSRPQSRENWE